MPQKTRSQQGLITWLTEAQRPLFIVDQRRRVRFFNDGCCRLTGCVPADIIGKTCDFTSLIPQSLSERVLQSITPPPEVFTGQELSSEISLIDAQGKSHELQLYFLPLIDEQQKRTVILGIIHEMQELQQQFPPQPSQKLHSQLLRLVQAQSSRFAENALIAHSWPMQKVVQQLKVAAKANCPLHLSGKAGTGKTFLAQVCFQMTNKQNLPLMELDCAQLPETEQRRLLKDACQIHRQPGQLDGIVLKHVDALSSDLQSWLSEFLQQRPADNRLRIFSTSQQRLETLVRQDTFLAELFYLLTPLTIEVPGLDERTADIPLLAQFFLELSNIGRENPLAGFEAEVLQKFQSYQWKYHVAELKKMVHETLPATGTKTLMAEDLPFRWQTGTDAQQLNSPNTPEIKPLDELLETVERTAFQQAIAAAAGNKARAADLLGISRPRLYRRLEQLQIGDQTPTGRSTPEMPPKVTE